MIAVILICSLAAVGSIENCTEDNATEVHKERYPDMMHCAVLGTQRMAQLIVARNDNDLSGKIVCGGRPEHRT